MLGVSEISWTLCPGRAKTKEWSVISVATPRAMRYPWRFGRGSTLLASIVSEDVGSVTTATLAPIFRFESNDVELTITVLDFPLLRVS